MREARVSRPPPAHTREASRDRPEQRIAERRPEATQAQVSARAARPSHYDRKLQDLCAQLNESKHENKEMLRGLSQLQEDVDTARNESVKWMRESRQLQLAMEERDEEMARLRTKAEDSSKAKKKQIETLQAQLDAQAHRVAEAERDLPERERYVRSREAAQTEREAAVSKREAGLAEREEKIGKEQVRINHEQAGIAEEMAQFRADHEAQVAQFRTEQELQRGNLAKREAQVAELEARVELEEARQNQIKQQLETKERQHIEACQEAQVLRSVRRPSAGTGNKENNELMKMMEEQQERMHNIKQLGWKQNKPEGGSLDGSFN